MSNESDIACLKEQVKVLEQRDVENEIRLNGLDTGRSVFAFAADAGLPNAQQDAVAAMMAHWSPEAYLFGGDNNYPSGDLATIEDNWENFQTQIDQHKVFPALGNHDMDNSGIGETPGKPQTDKFNYLPGNKRYYHKHFPLASVDLFVLNGGHNTAGELVEPDGIDDASKQAAWFRSVLSSAVGRHKVLMVHWPIVTSLDEGVWGKKWLDELDWAELNKVDIILSGHAHLNEALTRNGVIQLNASCIAQPSRTFSQPDVARLTEYTLYGNDVGSACLWRGTMEGPVGEEAINPRAGGFADIATAVRLIFDKSGITAEFWNAVSANHYRMKYRIKI